MHHESLKAKYSKRILDGASTMARPLPQAFKQYCKKALSRFSPRFKYDAELAYWRRELTNLREWFVDGSVDWWGLPPPREEQKVSRSTTWQTNAVLTLHEIYPTYYEELDITKDALSGMRVLEVGCGPLAPIMQFSGCERHGIDPLANAYLTMGWPLYDYDVRIINAFAERMPYENGYFDAILSVNALDHVDNFSNVAQEIQRVLKPGGSLYFELEYHEPTVTEPLKLNDDSVRSAFNNCEIHKKRERGKKELYRDLTARFRLLDYRFADYENVQRFALWHGKRK